MRAKSSRWEYGPMASSKVNRVMHERKEEKPKSDRSGKKVKSRKQAIAIGLSAARRSGEGTGARRQEEIASNGHIAIRFHATGWQTDSSPSLPNVPIMRAPHLTTGKGQPKDPAI